MPDHVLPAIAAFAGALIPAAALAQEERVSSLPDYNLVQLSVENWETEYLNHAKDEEARQAVCLSMLASVKRGHQLASGKEPQEYGFIWTFLLQMLASAVIQIILNWWKERASHRVLLVTMKAELTR